MAIRRQGRRAVGVCGEHPRVEICTQNQTGAGVPGVAVGVGGNRRARAGVVRCMALVSVGPLAVPVSMKPAGRLRKACGGRQGGVVEAPGGLGGGAGEAARTRRSVFDGGLLWGARAPCLDV